MLLAEVIPLTASPLRQGFSYAVPLSLVDQVRVGQVVTIPARRQTVAGVVIRLAEQPTPDYAVKAIINVLADRGLLPWQVTLTTHISQYYYAPLAATVRLFLPDKIWGGQSSPQYVYTVTWTAEESVPRSAKQRQVRDYLLAHPGVTLAELKTAGGVSVAYVRELAQKGWVKLIAEGLASHLPGTTTWQGIGTTLTPAQQACWQAITQARASTFLLHGVAGSGKTELFIHLAYHALVQGQTVLITEPEIGLVTPLYQRLQHIFGDQIALFSSDLSSGQRAQQWWRVAHGAARIVVGTRLALFAPFTPGLVIVDEEHEWTYKAEQSPKYHARWVAQQLSALTGATLVLASATPAFETYYAAQQGDIKLLSLPESYTP